MPSKKFKIQTLEIYKIFLSIAETERANKALPFKLAWELTDIKEEFKKHAVRYEEERTKIFEALGTKDESGGFTFAPGKTEELEAKIKELNETEIEIEFTPILLSRIEAFKDMQFAAGAFEVLRKEVIEFPAPKEKKEKSEDKPKEPEE
jgi:hypothetical protein